MSSTIDGAKGQVLAIFALSLTAVLMAAALAFDAGLIYLERRDQQNAADAAAIAGARYLTSNTEAARQAARVAAAGVATANGFTAGTNDANVAIHVPPATGPYAGRNGYIEVQVEATRPSIFAGIMGIMDWDVGARAVALNGDGSGGAFAILSLEPTQCPALDVTGSGSIVAHGNVQVNSSCTSPVGAMRITNNGSLVVDIQGGGGSCDVVGRIVGSPVCDMPPDTQVMSDPLESLPEPPMPSVVAPAPLSLDSPAKDIPDACPGSGDKKETTIADPATCTFGSSLGGTWRLYPGLYPGGLNFQAGTFYLEPGIYWIGGGGITTNAGGSDLISVPPGGTGFCSTPEQNCGIMIFNSFLDKNKDPDAKAGDVRLNGADANIKIHPYDGKPYQGIVYFQDRDIPPQIPELHLNGGDSDMEVRGTVYSPMGHVRVEGNAAKLTVDQVIADTYNVTGNSNGAQITALVDNDYIFRLRAAGLVE